MTRYLATRLTHAAVVVFLALTAVFFMVRLTGDPVLLFMPMDTSPKDIEEFRQKLGFNDPVWMQYGRFVGDALRGDFGESLRQQRPATEVVLEKLPATLELGFTAIIISVLVGIPLGMLSATRRGSVWDKIGTFLAVIGQAVPGFWLGLLLILLFSVWLQWLPTGGRGTWQQLIMPAITLGAFNFARYARLTRSTLLDVLGQDYVRTAHAKGLSSRVVMWRHALKNASIPIITVTGLQVGRVLGGAVIVEQIFAWPGLGRATIQALLNRDFPVVMAAVVIFALLYTITNLLTDLAYSWANPQVRLS